MKAAHVLVAGRVQGVGFRAWTADAATRSNLNGWVRNLADGRVEAWLEGPGDAVDRVLASMHDGPTSARVDTLSARPVDPSGRVGFEVHPTAAAPIHEAT